MCVHDLREPGQAYILKKKKKKKTEADAVDASIKHLFSQAHPLPSCETRERERGRGSTFPCVFHALVRGARETGGAIFQSKREKTGTRYTGLSHIYCIF